MRCDLLAWDVFFGEKPAKINQRLHDVFIEDFRRQLNEIHGSVARKLFVLAKGQPLGALAGSELYHPDRGSRYARASGRRSAPGKLPGGQTRVHGKDEKFDPRSDCRKSLTCLGVVRKLLEQVDMILFYTGAGVSERYPASI